MDQQLTIISILLFIFLTNISILLLI